MSTLGRQHDEMERGKMSDSTNPPTWEPDEWVCSHYQRKDFDSDLDVFEHLGHCYVDYPGYQ